MPCTLHQHHPLRPPPHPIRTQHHPTTRTRTTHHSTSQHNIAQHNTAPHSTAWHITSQHSTAQHSTAQHSTAQPHSHSRARHAVHSRARVRVRVCAGSSDAIRPSDALLQQNLCSNRAVDERQTAAQHSSSQPTIIQMCELWSVHVC